MFSVETTLLGVALALDAAVVSFAVGILNLEISMAQKIKRGLIICTLFGFFQALMIWFGSLGGYFLIFSKIGHFYNLFVALVFILIGMRFFHESLKNEIKEVVWELIPIVILAVVTSIDALVSGISMGPLPEAHTNALEIGIITFFICGIAFTVSMFFKSFPSRWLLRLASVIFFALGGRILIDIF
jgi:putative Mn2+ efflux pump MntP